MFRRACLVVCALLLFFQAAPALAGQAPTILAGIALGEPAAHSKGRIRTKTARTLDGAPWLKRMKITPDKYFSSGYVLVGTCAAPGRVARIKARYRDDSLPFFRNVSGAMLTRYGEPAEYKGGVDGRMMGNKWSFSDPWLRPISLILQRVDGSDPETGAGNTIKLSNWGLLEAEEACWRERHGHSAPKAVTEPAKKDHGYLPR